MLTLERQQAIVDYLKKKKSTTVTELSKLLFIGEATIRRDLNKLEKEGVLKRTYGGAVLLEGLDIEIPLAVRVEEQKKPKEVIGQLAAGLVSDGNIIVIDSSSTALRMIPYLKDRANLTVITNGNKTSMELGELLHTKVYCTGGILRENSMSFIGELARKCIQEFYTDLLFFSCKSISMEGGLSDVNNDEAELRRLMIRNCEKAVLLCDSSKFDTKSFCHICDFKEIRCVITEKEPPKRWMEFFTYNNVEVLYGQE